MGKHTDVTINASGLPEGTPIGMTISYTAGQIPAASVDLAPPGNPKITGGFGDIDPLKRKGEVSLSASVRAFTGAKGYTTRTVSFKGLLDGMSIGNMVGNNSYQVILKNKAQVLLEVTTLTPGLYPTSVNIYKCASFATTTGDDPESTAQIKWTEATNKLDHSKNVIEFYKDLMVWCLDTQLNNYKSFMGNEKMVSGELPFKVIFESEKYKKTLKQAIELFKTIDLSPVTSGSIGKTTAKVPGVADKLKEIFITGPNVLLENFLNFLHQLGCTMIFSNNKMYVVPDNSVIKQDATTPGKKEMQTIPNRANPADYNGYMYNDNGYRDIAAVVVEIGDYVGSTWLAGTAFERGYTAMYMDEKLSNASGVLVVPAHPWVLLSSTSPFASDAKKDKNDFDGNGAMANGKKGLGGAASTVKSKTASTLNSKPDQIKAAVSEILNNYAETKFYQSRYQDRHGSITMDFNPNWVPGTGGTLFVRETGMTIAFYVTNVTHRIDTSAPNNGSAITVVNFSCGRMGKEPAGTVKDAYLGYDLDKESDVQTGFVEDNK